MPSAFVIHIDDVVPRLEKLILGCLYWVCQWIEGVTARK
jgi:hypothetical protein